jgi:hypothetical protein
LAPSRERFAPGEEKRRFHAAGVPVYSMPKASAPQTDTPETASGLRS